jgi:Arc/MetJ-type ribon-helix-helix transcriptional regulator
MTEPAGSEYVKLSVSLPADAAADLRAAVEHGAAPSVSAFVAAAVEERLRRAETLRRIADLSGGTPLPADAVAWARRTLGVRDATPGQVA